MCRYNATFCWAQSNLWIINIFWAHNFDYKYRLKEKTCLKVIKIKSLKDENPWIKTDSLQELNELFLNYQSKIIILWR